MMMMMIIEKKGCDVVCVCRVGVEMMKDSGELMYFFSSRRKAYECFCFLLRRNLEELACLRVFVCVCEGLPYTSIRPKLVYTRSQKKVCLCLDTDIYVCINTRVFVNAVYMCLYVHTYIYV